MAKLIITAGADAGKEITLSDTQVIGRLPSNAVPIKDEGSSRQNTRVYRAQGRFSVIDLNSKNGTYVNGDRVERADLLDGDEIRIGSTAFRFHAEPSDDAPVAAAAAAKRDRNTPLAGSPDDVISYGTAGPGGVSERAIRVSKINNTGTLRWLRTEISQHSGLFRALLFLGLLLLMAGLATSVYRLTAGS